MPLYKDQPLFADVDAYLRGKGFMLHMISGASGRLFRPLVIQNDASAWLNQLLWADAVYVRSFMDMEGLTEDQLLRMAVILHTVYGSYDLCAALLNHHDSRTGGSLAKNYIERLVASGGK